MISYPQESELQQPALFEGDKYNIHVMQVPLIGGDGQFLWNYALINKATGVREVHTDTLPGAFAMLYRLQGGMDEAEKTLAKEAEEKARKLKREQRLVN